MSNNTITKYNQKQNIIRNLIISTTHSILGSNQKNLKQNVEKKKKNKTEIWSLEHGVEVVMSMAPKSLGVQRWTNLVRGHDDFAWWLQSGNQPQIQQCILLLKNTFKNSQSNA